MIKMGKGVLIPTYKCNQRCTCCYAMADIVQARNEMSLEEAKKSIDFFASIGITTYTLLGGEPLIYAHILDVVGYALEKGITSWIVTNGAKLEDAQFGSALVEKGIIGGCISMFSTKPDVHDAVTKVKGSYRRLERALKNTLQFQWPFYPMFTLGSANAETIFSDVTKIASMGFTKIYINYGIPNVVEGLDVAFDLPPARLARITEELYLMQESLGVKFIFNCEKNKIPICLFNPKIFSEMVANKQIGFGCELVQGNTVVIEPGGDVLGCSHWVKHVLMNIYKDYASLTTLSAAEFWEIWMTGYPKQIRNQYNRYPYSTCSDCGVRAEGKCFGGCKTWHNSGVL